MNLKKQLKYVLHEAFIEQNNIISTRNDLKMVFKSKLL